MPRIGSSPTECTAAVSRHFSPDQVDKVLNQFPLESEPSCSLGGDRRGGEDCADELTPVSPGDKRLSRAAIIAI